MKNLDQLNATNEGAGLALHTVEQPENTSFFARFLEQRVLSMFAGADTGTITITLPSGQSIQNQGTTAGPEAHIHFKHWSAIWRYITGGELAFAESFMASDVDIPDLMALFTWYIANENGMRKHKKGNFISALLARFQHIVGNDNNRAGSKKNISHHYDLGNDFYRTWLDKSMTYSSADFSTTDDLFEAQKAKYARIAKAAQLNKAESVLEIGCGWGGFAEHAVLHHNALYKGITISAEQLAFAKERLQTLPESELFFFEDYRDTNGEYDSIVSIEMFEAVGEKHWDTYFETVKRLLKPGGHAAIQTITIDEDRFHSYREGVDFIQKYIFPGGMLPSKEEFTRRAQKAGLSVVDRYDFGAGYAETLRRWRARFIASWSEIKPQGFDTRFYRMWLYYLQYCEAGFDAGTIDVAQFTLKHNEDL